ncbi:unnamed protein product [Rotaria magnacalcarata]|uniref:Ig-like domain-containing protein n=1 Tax=Rotaria magnacalcarata TaxID=392030 RepID=A0A8S2K4A1_9BILA|nr:unnamed protein product [Rotaria magnacalcarata]
MAVSAPRFTKPPAIRQSPDDPTRLYFECQVQGTPKPDITWFQNENLISAASTKYKQTVTASTGNNYDVVYEISDLGANDAGTYKILVKNKAGEVTANVNLNFSNEDESSTTNGNSADGTAPTFIQKPIIKQENDGKRLIFECKIAADPKPDLFWSRDDVPIQDSGRYLLYCDALPNSSYVACLEIDDVNATDAGKYKISAKNKLGESNAHIQLNLDNQNQGAGGSGGGGRPAFTQAPTVRMFEESILLEGVCTADPVPSFTWTLDGKAINVGTKYRQGILSEGTTHRIFLEIAQLTKKDSGTYKLTAKNVKGDSSATIQLNIEGINYKMPDGLAPSFINKPSIKQDAKTVTVQFDISADPTPSLYWSKDGKELLNVDKIISRIDRAGANKYTVSLDIKNLAASDAGVYKCTLSNELGTAVANIAMKVAADKASLDHVDRVAPAFEKPKITQDAKQKSIKIECRCKGKPEPKIIWKKEKTELKDTPNKYKITKTKDANDTYIFILEILNATSTDSGIYKILAKNDGGDSQALVNLTVDGDNEQPKNEEEKKPKAKAADGNKMSAPVFTDKPKDVVATDGDKVLIQLKVSGTPTPEITWFFNKKEIKPSADYVQDYNGTTAKLTIPDGYVDDSGDWMCEAWNEAGEATQNVRVSIKEKRGKAKRVRKPAPKTAPKSEEEPSKKDQRKQAVEQSQKVPEAAPAIDAPPVIETPTIETPTILNTEDEDRRVPTIQANESVYEDEGPRRTQATDKPKRVSQAKLDVISENLSSKAKPRERKIRDPLEIHTEPLAPIFIEKPQNTSAKEGSSTFVEVVIDGNPFPKVTWYKEKVELVQGVKFKFELNPTTGIATLFIEKCRQKDEAPYGVTIQNEHGEVHAEFHFYIKAAKDDAADFRDVLKHRDKQKRKKEEEEREKINLKPPQIRTDQPEETGGDENGNGSRRSSVMDDRRPSLRRVDQEGLLKVRRDSKSRRPSLADVIPDWPALHKVKRAEKEKETFIEPLQDIKCIEEDGEITFTCTFCKPSVRLRWLKNKMEIFHGLKYHFDTNGAKQTLTIYKLHPDDSGKYFCRVNDVETSAWLEVTPAKPLYEFYKELPAKMEVFRTKQTILECHVNDPNAPIIWYKNGIPIDVS